MWENLLLVAAGSAFGGMSRFWLSGVVDRTIGSSFPWGTMTVNVSGAFAIGLLTGLASIGQGVLSLPGNALFAVTGFLGCYTTVSSFALQSFTLARQGRGLAAFVNVAASIALCLGSVVVGAAIAASWPWRS